jgi:hypothetical protein
MQLRTRQTQIAQTAMSVAAIFVIDQRTPIVVLKLMKFLKLKGLAVAAALVFLVHPVVSRAGLYEDDAKNATTGELNDQDYWWTKFDLMMLDLAIKQRQPEGHIAVDLASAGRRLNDLAKKYPKHDEIQKWKTRVAEVQAKINPDADRGKSFGPECPWDESNFAQLWVNLHWAKVAFDAKDYDTARSCMQNVMQNYEIMLRPDRMKDYPEELRKWVQDSKAEADKLDQAIKEKTNR